jgi:hypothetical protein
MLNDSKFRLILDEILSEITAPRSVENIETL